MPKQINTYQVGQALVRKFGLKGRFQPVLDEVIVPVVSVGESELADIRLAVGGRTAAAAGAGNQNLITMRNRLDTGVLITLTSWTAVSGAPLTDFVNIVPGRTTSFAGDQQIWRDRRIAGQPLARFLNQTSPTVAPIPVPHYHLDNDDKEWHGQWILQPGDILTWRQDAVNTTLDMRFEWTETALTATLGG